MPKTLRSLLCIVLILMLLTLAGCSKEVTYNKTVVEKFTEALAAQDFAKAHEYFWPYADYEKSEVFIEECEYIVEKLGVTEIIISNVNVTEGEEETTLSYTCSLRTAEAGTVTSDITAHVVIEDRNIWKPVKTQIHIMDAILKLYPDIADLEPKKRAGSGNFARQRMCTDDICEMFDRRESILPLIDLWQRSSETFMKQREPYLLY